jgi:flagellar motility protein MotE (MotC chaperone)
MKPGLRILPLVAVAMGGVLTIKALAGVESLPEMLSPRAASAAEAPPPGKAKPPTPPKAAPPPPKPAPAPVCAPSAAELAREAGMSPAELQVLQSLGNRRGQLDQRERDLDTKIQLLAAAEMKVDAKLKAMNALKAEVQGLLGQGDQQTQAEVDRLVQVYSKMKPADAAAVMATLDDGVRVPVAAKMRPAVLAAILGKMQPADAKRITESLARRFAPQQTLAQALAARTAAVDPLAAPPPPPEPPEGDVAAEAKAKPKAKPVLRPRRVARRAPPRTPVSAKPAAAGAPVTAAAATPAPQPAAAPQKPAA